MKTTNEEIYVIVILFAVAISSEVMWLILNKKIEPLLSPTGLVYFRACLGAISLYNLGLILGAIIFIFVLHGFQRHLLPSVIVYLASIIPMLSIGALRLVEEILLKYFPK